MTTSNSGTPLTRFRAGVSRRRFLQALATAAAGAAVTTGQAAEPAPRGEANRRHTLVVLDPGHFHAGLTLRNSHPALNDDVYVYAPEGPDVDNFLRMVATFNARTANPTAWKLHVYRGADFMQRLRAERPGDMVIISGRNDTKMSSIHTLHGDGLFVLGDKPWVTDVDQIGMLQATLAGGPLAMDIMTERHQAATQVQRALSMRPEVFGEFRRDGGEPAIFFKSIHHLYKVVNDRPLVRPQWFFDTAVQGEGMVDVTTHLVDLAQWMTEGDRPFSYERDVALEAARQWPTGVPLDIFSRITGLAQFPAALREHVTGTTLQYLCNAGINYRLRGIPVQIESLWNLAIPEGGGDTHYAILRGTRADLVVDQGPETQYRTRLTVRPHADAQRFGATLATAVEALQGEFPGLDQKSAGGGYEMVIPDALRTGHEAHFAAVLDAFLGYIDAGTQPARLAPDIATKYTLLARAKDMAGRP